MLYSTAATASAGDIVTTIADQTAALLSDERPSRQ
jgi:hypothetical protein